MGLEILLWAVFAKYNLPHLRYKKCICLCFFLNLFIHLFLAVLGLRCCAQAFSRCSKGELLSFRCGDFSLLRLLSWSTGSGVCGLNTQGQ